jgi:hypothetical protein
LENYLEKLENIQGQDLGKSGWLYPWLVKGNPVLLLNMNQ